MTGETHLDDQGEGVYAYEWDYDAAGGASEVDNRKSDMSVISSSEYARENAAAFSRSERYKRAKRLRGCRP